MLINVISMDTNVICDFEANIFITVCSFKSFPVKLPINPIHIQFNYLIPNPKHIALMS